MDATGHPFHLSAWRSLYHSLSFSLLLSLPIVPSLSTNISPFCYPLARWRSRAQSASAVRDAESEGDSVVRLAALPLCTLCAFYIVLLSLS